MPELLVTPCRSALKTALIVAGMLSLSLACADPLKVCSDPDNMPFSEFDIQTLIGSFRLTERHIVWV